MHTTDKASEKNTEPVALFEGPTLRLFRGYRFLGLIAAAVACGALGTIAVQQAQQRQRDSLFVVVDHIQPAAAAGPRQLRWPLTLPSPTGEQVTLTGPAIVNVWLQGCADCIPAFEANKQLMQAGGYGSDVALYNIAYGRADTSWAQGYLVDAHLVFDGGAAVVQPLGIGTFTTLVVDAAGGVTVIGSPVAADHKQRVLAALAAARPAPEGFTHDEVRIAGRVLTGLAAPASTPLDDPRVREGLAFLRGQARSYAAAVTRDTPAECQFQARVGSDGAVSVTSQQPGCAWDLSTTSVRTTAAAPIEFAISVRLGPAPGAAD
jgi:hypothetical protein